MQRTKLNNPNFKKIILKSLVIASLGLQQLNAISQVPAQTVSNGVITLGVTPSIHGGGIDSLKVVGTETIDNADLGRQLQASLFFPTTNQTNTCYPSTPLPPWLNPQEVGDICGRVSPVWGGGPGPNGSGEINVGTYPLDYDGSGATPIGLSITGNHKIGPLPYSNVTQVARLLYTIKSEASSITALHQVGVNSPSNGNATPVPFIPAIYFKGNTLTRLYGLSIDGSTWTEVTNNTNIGGSNGYDPSLYRYRAMAWMRPDLGWGVGIYGRWTLNQKCTRSWKMALAEQQGQCPNFAAQRFPNTFSSAGSGGVNNISLVDQTLGTIPAGGSVSFMPHVAVGDLNTIKGLINGIYNSGY